ncbi:MAG: electron transport complex subunit E [Clostridia bacterium]|nr:electron transport complex subunit E [Clostridia bacterium]
MSEKKKSFGTVFKEALFDNNPVLGQLLGMCSTLAVTTSVVNSIGMGVATTAVLFFSNIFISLLRNFIPKEVRIASYIVIISGFVTAVQFLMQAYVEDLYESLGLFIPLIVVNCIILGRAEAFASKNNVAASALDGLVMGIGYTVALIVLGTVREIIGNGSFLGYKLFGESFEPVTMVSQAPGAFIILGCLIALMNFMLSRKKSKEAKKQ